MKVALWAAVTLNVLIPAVLSVDALGEQGGGDGLEFFNRIYSASQRLSYTGTLVYQQGTSSETARVARMVDASGTRERVEVMDGSPREIIRTHGELECYLPSSSTLKIERAITDRSLLPIFPTSRNIADFYTMRKGGVERISGFDCQTLILEPKDTLRYGHKFWADTVTGMLLKAQTLSENGEVLEQFLFTQLKIGPGFPKDQLVSHYRTKLRDWHVEESAAHPADLAANGWTVGTAPPGYVKLAELRRMLGHNNEVGQIVLSDGLSAVSIFIEPAARVNPAPIGASRAGAFNVYKRRLDDHFVTAMGEAPAASVRAIADGMKYRH